MRTVPTGSYAPEDAKSLNLVLDTTSVTFLAFSKLPAYFCYWPLANETMRRTCVPNSKSPCFLRTSLLYLYSKFRPPKGVCCLLEEQNQSLNRLCEEGQISFMGHAFSSLRVTGLTIDIVHIWTLIYTFYELEVLRSPVD